MKKITKLSLHQLDSVELDERKMCRILGGGTPGCCQCGCHYTNKGGSSKSSNDSANNAKGLTSDPVTEVPTKEVEPYIPFTHPDYYQCNHVEKVDAICSTVPPQHHCYC